MAHGRQSGKYDIFYPHPFPMPSGVGFLFGGLDVVNLTPKQEKFAQCVADGMSQADAYRTAYDCKPTTKPESIQDSAYKVMANPDVYQRVEELREQLAEKSLWSRADSVRVLAGIANSGAGENAAKPTEIVAAVKELNAMHGWNKQTIDHVNSDGSLKPVTRIRLIAPSQTDSGNEENGGE